MQLTGLWMLVFVNCFSMASVLSEIGVSTRNGQRNTKVSISVLIELVIPV